MAYRGGSLLEQAVASCEAQAGGIPTLVVDNSPPEARVARYLTGRVTWLPQPANLGFAAGANIGLTEALEQKAPMVLLLNEDAQLQPGAWDALVGALQQNERAGAVQPAIMRGDGTVNSLGNPVHRLGFAWAGGDGMLVAQAESDQALPWLKTGQWRHSAVEIPTFSGAAVLLRGSALRQVGLFEDRLYSYFEDVELSLRMRRAGWKLMLAGAAVVTHHYEFSRNPEKFRLLEKNRVWVLLAHLRFGTILRLLPFLAAAELAVLAQAARQGWLRQKLAAYPHYLPTPRRWLRLQQRRRDLKGLNGGPDDLALFNSATWRLPPLTARIPPPTVRWAESLRTSDTLVMIPAHNERRGLAVTLDRLRDSGLDADVVVVDNGSVDGSGSAARARGVRVLRLPFDLGAGGATRAALRFAVLNDYQRAVRLQCGDDPAAISALLEKLSQGTDLAIASRQPAATSPSRSRPPIRARLLGAALWLGTGRHFQDASSGFRAFSRRMLEFFAAEHPSELLSDGAEATLAACAAGFNVVELPIPAAAGGQDSSLPMGYHYLRALLTLITHSVPRRRHWRLLR